MRPVLKRNGCLQSLPVCLSVLPDSMALRLFSENGREMLSFTSTWSMSDLEQTTSRRHFWENLSSPSSEGRFAIWRNLGGKFHRLRQSYGVIQVLCRSAMAGKRGINTQPISMVTFEITTFEEESERVEMSG